ncbi:MarR family winged helix-turn-helix transcriptional regulator [Clostridium saccharobutylicum]|uniref:Multiple antibiotic resistance protein MarR n=1 Tax=Clostridium saccharobutylicum TaxID=169679 RepID=A0A1S8NCK9_CLOSA|nr:MarR family transcriptional regulator [Clostridium saccharobutylicum]OOM14207.1 multiple antibiotic resistance protein MarR [Clostridium saccharobutylicum]
MNEVNSKNFRELIRILERKLGLLNKQDSCCLEVTLAQCHALVEIGRAENISLKDLANLIDLDISTMSRTVDSLVKKEFVFRTPSKADRRSVDIKLTEKGLKLFTDIESNMDNKFKNIFNQISLENQLIVFNGLNIIIEALAKNESMSTCCNKDITNKCNKTNKN